MKENVVDDLSVIWQLHTGWLIYSLSRSLSGDWRLVSRAVQRLCVLINTLDFGLNVKRVGKTKCRKWAECRWFSDLIRSHQSSFKRKRNSESCWRSKVNWLSSSFYQIFISKCPEQCFVSTVNWIFMPFNLLHLGPGEACCRAQCKINQPSWYLFAWPRRIQYLKFLKLC